VGKMMKKILFVHHTNRTIGGIERLLNRLYAILKKEGYELYGLFREIDEKQENLRCFNEYYLNVEGKLEKVVTALKKKRVDLALINKGFSNQDLWLLNNSFKTICFVHDHDFYCMRRHKYYPFMRKNCLRSYHKFYCALCSMLVTRQAHNLRVINPFSFSARLELLKQCRAYLVLSEYMKSNLKANGFQERKIFKLVVPQQENRCPAETKKKRLAFVGQIIRGKGLDLLIKALALTKSRDWELIVMGDGNDLPYVKQLVKQKKLEKEVQFLGWQEHPEKHLEQVKGLVLPARWQEPFGLVGLEALAQGIPVVAFDVGGIQEWFTDGENGYLVKPFLLEELAKKIDALLADDKKWQEMSKNARKRVVESFNEQQFLTSLRMVLNNV
jgi:glycosyltransferase involved in cell wall biosynthesis